MVQPQRSRAASTLLGVMCLLAVSLLYGGETPRPGQPVNPSGNLLKGMVFSKLQPPTEAEKKKLDSFQVTVGEKGVPVQWKFRLSGNAKNTQSTFTFDKEGGVVLAHAQCPENVWNGVQLMMRQGVLCRAMRDGKHTFGIWAKGNGTISLELVEFIGSRQVASQKVSFQVTQAWDFYRSGPLSLKNNDTDRIAVSVSVYGDILFAAPEIAPIATPDAVAELLFYAPFDHGAPEALFSAGAAGVFGASEHTGVVPGVVGDALRIDSKRRLTPLGYLRLPMGLQYMHLGDAISREEGTLEFWFRPLREDMEGKKWKESPLFKIGNSSSAWMWPNSEDISLFIRNSNGQFFFDYREHERYLRYPDETPVKIQPEVNEWKKSHPIKNAKAFFDQWHHLALTWTKKARRLYLDGTEILSIERSREPVITSRKPSLFLGCTALSQPFVASCDFDELKIYRRCRYRENFTPKAEAAPFRQIEEKSAAPSKEEALTCQPQPFAAELKGKDEAYRLQVEICDGLPLIYSSKNAANTVKAPNHPELTPLEMAEVRMDGNTATASLPRRDTTCRCTIEEQPDRILVTLRLKRGDKTERVYLEPRITLENGSKAPWTSAYDGFTERPILLPFRPFAFQDLQTALPLAGAWNWSSGMVLALTPENLTSFLSRGMTAPNRLCLKTRTVLDAGQEMAWSFEVFRVNGKYASDAMVDGYHGRHPAFFTLNPRTDPRLTANIAQTNIWNSAAYRKRKAQFSLSEISRRIRGRWCWYYWTGAATGNWSVNPQLLSEFPPLNEARVGDAKFSRTIFNTVRRESEKLRDSGVNPSLYISSWAEKRLATNFRDSRFDASETENGIYFWPNYWSRGVTDYIMLPSGGRYGLFLRSQIDNMLRQYPGTNSFSHDLFGGDYYFRKETDLGGLRAFDEEGAYTHNLAAMGRFLDDVLAKKTLSPYTTAVIGNGHAQVASFNTFFRAANTIHERSMTWTLQDWGNLAQQARLMGEKPSTFFDMPSLLGNYMDPEKDSVELLRYSLVSLQHSQLLLGMLFNVNVNWSVLGVKESIPMIDELLRVHALGYRACQAFEASPTLGKARYGTPQLGALVLVNLSPEKRHSAIRPDAEYLQGIPLLVREGAPLRVVNGETESIEVPPLSWAVVEMAGALQGKNMSYTSRMERKRAGRTMQWTFEEGVKSDRLEIRLGANERLVSITKNGIALPYSLHEGSIVLKNVAFTSGETLDIVTSDARWHDSMEELLALPFENGQICAAGELKGQGERIVEFFHFWGANQQPPVAFTLAVQERPDNNTRWLLECSDKPAGITLENGRVVIRGKDKREVSDYLEEFLAALEKRYPYTGFFGNQMPVYEWDYATTGEQRKLLKKSGIVRTTQSTEEVAAAFLKWMKAHGVDASRGF